MTLLSLPQWQVVLRWDDGARSTVRYAGWLWIGAMSHGVHQLALACYAQRRATEPELPKHMSYLILSFTLIERPVEDMALTPDVC
ncbi:hypothetical protein HNQ08_005515 [Deinococcus humi]|uniref:Uncharacterized protein n=1 Tax=Deinococcus humi TaxID=662880 RepID=A0A7W8K2M2_9DEIO|nr:hypothetical protein [Deinococcus humi]GGO41531.1 hypothetical protein GCM10008949_52520 [Deinococcus humi]